VHPADGNIHHELYLMCDDIHATLAELKGKGAEVARDVSDQGWGLLAGIRLPDGSELPIYQPRHPSPRNPDRTHSSAAYSACGYVELAARCWRRLSAASSVNRRAATSARDDQSSGWRLGRVQGSQENEGPFV
jgi:hypothetical protein